MTNIKIHRERYIPKQAMDNVNPAQLSDMHNTLGVADSIVNSAKGYGTSSDPSYNSAYGPNMMMRRYGELAASFEYWLPRKIVELIPDDAMAKPWKHKCPSLSKDQIDILTASDKEFKVREKFTQAWKWERLFGFGSVAMLFNEDMGLYRDELTPSMVKKGSLTKLDVYDPQQAYPMKVSLTDLTDKFFREPITYSMGTPGYMKVNVSGLETPGVHDAAIMHHSRLVTMNGMDLPWYSRQNNFYHGQSIISSVNQMISMTDLVTQSVASLLYRLSVPVFKTPRLRDVITDDIARGAFQQRMQMLNTTMSSNNMALIDAEEELVNLQQSGLSGVEALVARYFGLLSVCCDIPQTKFMGTAPQGMNATGDSDQANYVKSCEAKRGKSVDPGLEEYYNLAFPSILGIERPKDHCIEHAEMNTPNTKEKAETDNKNVNSLSMMLEDGIIDKVIYLREAQTKCIIEELTPEDEARILNTSKIKEEDMRDALLFEKRAHPDDEHAEKEMDLKEKEVEIKEKQANKPDPKPVSAAPAPAAKPAPAK